MFSLEKIGEMAERAAASLMYESEPRNLYEPIEYMMSIGGKRLRPRICLMTYNLFSDKIDNSIIRPAMALELFHEFTLLHDDIMDKSDTRRGNVTVHKKWNDNVAILSGDTMSLLAYKYLADAPAEVLSKALNLFTKTAIEVCEGQQYDMDFESLSCITMEEYLKMIGLKTAVLLACSAKMGALLAGADNKVADALYNYAYQLGLAFQITDDYLDTFGDEHLFGKKIGGDIANNKKSWLLVSCMKKAQGADREKLFEIMKMKERDAKVEAMQQLYVELGIKEEALTAILSYEEKAMEALQPAALSTEQTLQLENFAKKLLNREK